MFCMQSVNEVLADSQFGCNLSRLKFGLDGLEFDYLECDGFACIPLYLFVLCLLFVAERVQRGVV